MVISHDLGFDFRGLSALFSTCRDPPTVKHLSKRVPFGDLFEVPWYMLL